MQWTHAQPVIPFCWQSGLLYWPYPPQQGRAPRKAGVCCAENWLITFGWFFAPLTLASCNDECYVFGLFASHQFRILSRVESSSAPRWATSTASCRREGWCNVCTWNLPINLGIIGSAQRSALDECGAKRTKSSNVCWGFQVKENGCYYYFVVMSHPTRSQKWCAKLSHEMFLAIQQLNA